MSQQYVWPSPSVTATNPSVAANGASPSAPSSTLVAGQNPSGDQQSLQTDGSGNLLVSASFSPSGTQDVNLTQVGGAAVSLGQKAMTASIPVVLSSDQSAVATSNAIITARLSGSLVPAAYDEIQLTYTGNNITTAVYKLATVTVKTLTLSYTGDRLDSVVAS